MKKFQTMFLILIMGFLTKPVYSLFDAGAGIQWNTVTFKPEDNFYREKKFTGLSGKVFLHYTFSLAEFVKIGIGPVVEFGELEHPIKSSSGSDIGSSLVSGPSTVQEDKIGNLTTIRGAGEISISFMLIPGYIKAGYGYENDTYTLSSGSSEIKNKFTGGTYHLMAGADFPTLASLLHVFFEVGIVGGTLKNKASVSGSDTAYNSKVETIYNGRDVKKTGYQVVLGAHVSF